MIISLKADVRAQGLSNEILLAIVIAGSIYEQFENSMTITSLTDGTHRAGSLHYTGDAVDLRLPKQNATGLVAALRDALGLHYDVILEKDHIHIEHDPRR
jgi:hypothetical protein